MKVSALQEFLRNLGGSLGAVGVPAKSLEDLRAVTQVFAPFADLELDQLAGFLERAAEYRRTGAVPTVTFPGLDAATHSARKIGELVQTLGEAADTEVESHIVAERMSLQSALGTVAKQFGLAATFKADKKWLQELQSAKAVTNATESLRRLQSQITSAESYHSEPVQEAIEQIASLDSKVLKAAAAQIGAAGTGTGKKYVETLLVKLTGISNKLPTTAKKAKAPEPTATDEQVETMVATLKAMVEKAKDPDAVADAEIEAILTRVGREFSTAQQKTIAKRVTGNSGASSKAAIGNLRADLTAVKRALESQKV